MINSSISLALSAEDSLTLKTRELYIIMYKMASSSLTEIKTCCFFCFSLKKVPEIFGGF